MLNLLLSVLALLVTAVAEEVIAIPRKHVEPSHVALAKRKAAVGQAPGGGTSLQSKLDAKEPKEGVKLVDMFSLVMSEQRGEDRTTLFARDDWQTNSAYGDIPKEIIQRLNDKAYRSAFRSALKKVIKPDSVVLILNCKEGLLAMMAASIGAHHVYGVEANKAYVDVARELIEANGLQDRITIIHKEPIQVNTTEIPFKADVIVQERIESTLMASMMHFEMQLAMVNFMKEGGSVIPKAGNLFGFAVESVQMRKGRRVTGDVAGFDFSRLNRLSPAVASSVAYLDDFDTRSLTDIRAAYLSSFEKLDSKEDAEKNRLPSYFQFPMTVVTAGILDSFIFYWELWLDATTKLSTDPARGKQHKFLDQIICSVTPRYVKAGDVLTLLIGFHVGQIQADVIKINDKPVGIPSPEASQAV